MVNEQQGLPGLRLAARVFSLWYACKTETHIMYVSHSQAHSVPPGQCGGHSDHRLHGYQAYHVLCVGAVAQARRKLTCLQRCNPNARIYMLKRVSRCPGVSTGHLNQDESKFLEGDLVRI